ncbi:MAG: LPS export ABC transporter permease LptF [Reyranellaceae bacterium]
MTRIDRYVLERTLTPLVATVSIALIALLMERMVRLMEVLVSQGGPLFLVLRMISNLIPHYLGLALPAALFIGIMLATTRLSVDSELDAMNAVGVGLRRLLWPLMGLAFLISIVVFVLYSYLQPHTRYAYRALVYAATNSVWDLALEKGAFFTGLGGYTVMVDDIARDSGKLLGVFIYRREEDGRTIAMTAESGQAFRRPQELQIVLRLERGVRTEIRADNGQATALTFDAFELPIDVALPTPFRERVSERELTIGELWAMRNKSDDTRPRQAAVWAEFHGRLVRTLSLLIIPLLAVPLGLVTRRNERNIGIVVGVVLMVFYHNMINFGETIATIGNVGPGVALWLPFLLFAAFSVWLFATVSTWPRENPVVLVFARIAAWREAALEAIVRRVRA